jgi:hypothetical protein
MLDAGSESDRRMLGGKSVIAAAVAAVRPASCRNLRRRSSGIRVLTTLALKCCCFRILRRAIQNIAWVSLLPVGRMSVFSSPYL